MKNALRKHGVLPILVIPAAYISVALAIENPYYQLVLTLVPIWAVFGISWNTLSGYTGLISFGHSAFFGIGAYTVVLATRYWDLSPVFGIPLAAVVAVFSGVLVGIPTFRLRGHYFALAMLAYPLAMLYVFEWMGFQEVTFPMKHDQSGWYLQFKDPRVYTAISVGLLIAALLIGNAIERSRFGLALQAIKQNEAAAEAAGINTVRWKFLAMMVSAGMAGVAGGFYAVVLLVVTPQTVFGLMTSAQALIVTLFGGIGSVWGPVIGSAILIPLSEFLNDVWGQQLPGIHGVLFGVAIIVAVLVAPEGIFWAARDLLSRKVKSRASHTDGSSDAGSGQTEYQSVEAPPLRVTNISKSFGGIRAVNGVSFTVQGGELVGIIGPNGAGKTSLFNLLNGFTHSDTGSVLFGSKELVGLRPHEVCRSGIGRTFQVVRSFPRLSVLSNVIVGAFPNAQDGQEARELSIKALAMTGLLSKKDIQASQLTSIELRLMELARALAGRPRLILLDEPLAGLGGQEVVEFLSVVTKLSNAGISIVMIEHTMHAMVDFVDRFIVLDHGTLIADGPPKEVLKNPVVIEAYLGKRWKNHA